MSERTYAEAKVGDRFGSRIVIAIAKRDHTRNERVRWRCEICGHERDSYVFNLRDALPSFCIVCRPRPWRLRTR